MNQNTLTEKQKELLRKIVEADNSGKLPESSIVHTMRGDDVYNLLGLGIKLQSLADLDALCDAGFLVKEYKGSDPQYRIKNQAKEAVANDFRGPELQQIDLLIAKGQEVINNPHEVPGLPGFIVPDPDACSEWMSLSLSFLTRLCGQNHPYIKEFQSKGDPNWSIDSLKAHLGVLKAVHQDLMQGIFVQQDAGNSPQEQPINFIFQAPILNSTFIAGNGNTQINVHSIFEPAYKAIEKSSYSEEIKAEIKAKVQEVETEARKGNAADEAFLARRLRNLKRMAPDIAEVTLAGIILGPIGAASMTIKKIAEKVKKEIV